MKLLFSHRKVDIFSSEVQSKSIFDQLISKMQDEQLFEVFTKDIDINNCKINGESLLHYLVNNGYYRLLEKALEKSEKIDFNIIDAEGKTIIQKIIQHNNYETAISVIEKNSFDINHMQDNFNHHILSLTSEQLNKCIKKDQEEQNNRYSFSKAQSCINLMKRILDHPKLDLTRADENGDNIIVHVVKHNLQNGPIGKNIIKHILSNPKVDINADAHSLIYVLIHDSIITGDNSLLEEIIDIRKDDIIGHQANLESMDTPNNNTNNEEPTLTNQTSIEDTNLNIDRPVTGDLDPNNE